MNIAIIEDLKEDYEKEYHVISSYFNSHKLIASIDAFENGEQFFDSYIPGKYQLIFLDIYMSEMTGMDVARKLREQGDGCNLIFITSSDRYAVASYDVGAVYYLLKPFNPAKLAQILDTLHADFLQESHYVEVVSDRMPLKIPVHSILYVSTYRNTLELHTDAGIITTYMTFQSFEDLIADDHCFLSCYRGCIVNMDRIHEAAEDGFLMDNQEMVRFRKRGSNLIKKTYLEYLFNERNTFA